MRAIATLALALLTVNACASNNPPAPTYKVYAIPGRPAPVERVTPEMWAEAQAQAARLSGGLLSLSRAAPAQLVHLPIGQLCDLLGRCPHAAAYDRVHQVTYLRNDRPWASDHGHSYGIVIHEAAHSLQSDDMPPNCREAQAYEIQMAWLAEQGRDTSAVAEDAARFSCAETAVAAALLPW